MLAVAVLGLGAEVLAPGWAILDPWIALIPLWFLAAYLAGFLMVAKRVGEEVSSGPNPSPRGSPVGGTVNEHGGRDRFGSSASPANGWGGGLPPLPQALSRGTAPDNALPGAASSLHQEKVPTGARRRSEAAGSPGLESRRTPEGEPGGAGLGK